VHWEEAVEIAVEKCFRFVVLLFLSFLFLLFSLFSLSLSTSSALGPHLLACRRVSLGAASWQFGRKFG